MIVETCLGVLHPSFTACLVWLGLIRTKDEMFILSQSYIWLNHSVPLSEYSQSLQVMCFLPPVTFGGLVLVRAQSRSSKGNASLVSSRFGDESKQWEIVSVLPCAIA